MLLVSLFVIVIDTWYRNYTIGTFWTIAHPEIKAKAFPLIIKPLI